ncbi:thioredoxin-dependent thiol peroxidase [Alienimonas chondri]|uniref:thioredoxin-dependent peroxiredoxin n=1 Tax=Alienimonas chondri TaxID=2681879 RepID=A0ABX1VCX5_9PLAN|nr:thioredoxin-dependent thiol peroxidase [Alienimonas chondri]NNJ25963.1 Peroxiredoxin [Alienimonas chondri]
MSENAPAADSPAPPTAGDAAPDGSCVVTPGDETLTLSEVWADGPLVLYFYPKDATPGCTTEACDFRDRTDEMTAAGVTVLGVSPDPPKSHQKFIDKQSLPFRLLSDEDHALSEAYGVWVEKSMYGRKYMGVQRSTFLIAQGGTVASAWPKVKVNGHVDAVLTAIEALPKS